MSVPHNWLEPAVPSKQAELLRQTIGRTLTKLVRFSREAPLSLTRPGAALDGDEPLKPQQVFSFAAGPLVMGFDTGLEIAVGADERCEIHLNLRRHPNGKQTDHLFENEPGYHVLDAGDGRFCREEIHRMLGKRILDVRLLRMDGQRYGKNRTFEVGVVFYVEGCPELVLSGGLTEGLDDFAVTLREEILPENRRYLTEERLAPAGS